MSGLAIEEIEEFQLHLPSQDGDDVSLILTITRESHLALDQPSVSPCFANSFQKEVFIEHSARIATPYSEAERKQ